MKHWLIVGGSLLIWAAMGLVRRYGVEPESIGLLCQAATPPWWCSLRLGLILAVHHQLIGYLAAALGGIALLAPGMLWGGLAMAVGAAGLAFYNVSWAAAGFILGLLAVWDVRPRHDATLSTAAAAPP
ncbi:MAG: hypothetical protein HQM06_13785 [Magnetococcales bacterium]|nr:hypothetical protein [Magnetococcales bacterium]